MKQFKLSEFITAQSWQPQVARVITADAIYVLESEEDRLQAPVAVQLVLDERDKLLDHEA